MAGKNLPIATGFVIITLSQLFLGIILIVVAARSGRKINPSDKKTYFHPALSAFLCLRSPTFTADTPRRI